MDYTCWTCVQSACCCCCCCCYMSCCIENCQRANSRDRLLDESQNCRQVQWAANVFAVSMPAEFEVKFSINFRIKLQIPKLQNWCTYTYIHFYVSGCSTIKISIFLQLLNAETVQHNCQLDMRPDWAIYYNFSFISKAIDLKIWLKLYIYWFGS